MPLVLLFGGSIREVVGETREAFSNYVLRVKLMSKERHKILVLFLKGMLENLQA